MYIGNNTYHIPYQPETPISGLMTFEKYVSQLVHNHVSFKQDLTKEKCSTLLANGHNIHVPVYVM